MSKKRPIVDQKKMIKYIGFHIDAVMNILMFLVENQESFKMIVHDPLRKYADIFPEEAYEHNRITLHLTGWSLEIASILEADPHFYTTLAMGEGTSVQEFNISIEAIDIEMLIIDQSPSMPLYSRFFEIKFQSKTSDDEQKQDSSKTHQYIDTSKFESTNKDGIDHSMSKLTLLTPKKDT